MLSRLLFVTAGQVKEKNHEYSAKERMDIIVVYGTALVNLRPITGITHLDRGTIFPSSVLIWMRDHHRRSVLVVPFIFQQNW